MITARMPFGKHRGKLLEDIPDSYLAWLLRECDLDGWLLDALWNEAERRYGAMLHRHQDNSPAVQWEPVLREWYRGLALSYHPDRGGHPEAMKAVNEAYERLRRLLGAA